MVVNNCAAALLLAMAALAKGRPVIVSRGELIEIGGEFRIPDILAASGRGSPRSERRTDEDRRLPGGGHGQDRGSSRCTRRTTASIGFTATPAAADLAALARKHDIPFLYDIGSGPSITAWTSG